MSFSRDRRTRTRIQLGWWVLGVGILGLISWLGVRSVVKKTADDLPLAAPSTVYNTLLSKKTLVQKIVEMRTTIESYEAELATAALLREENESLKAELGHPAHTRGVLAHVRTLPGRSIYGTFKIDAGTSLGVEVGQTVYAFNTIALGTITEASNESATVKLFSASNESTSGTVMGSDVAVTLIGRGGGEYEVRMPRDVHFDVGSIIAYQSTQTAVLASVERIASDPRDPFQKLYAKAPINLQALKWVIVR